MRCLQACHQQSPACVSDNSFFIMQQSPTFSGDFCFPLWLPCSLYPGSDTTQSIITLQSLIAIEVTIHCKNQRLFAHVRADMIKRPQSHELKPVDEYCTTSFCNVTLHSSPSRVIYGSLAYLSEAHSFSLSGFHTYCPSVKVFTQLALSPLWSEIASVSDLAS